jgi:threonyl-tRNA synthetase
MAKERFGLSYTDNEGKENNNVFVIHRAPLSTHERFMAFLIEHFAGAFPLWLSPVQVRIASVSDEKHGDFCRSLAQLFRAARIRCDIDDSHETIGNKIRKSSNEKIPYTLVIGDKEMASKELAIRIRGEKDFATLDSGKFIKTVATKIFNRSAELKM